jgi:uncharacterized protein (TIGR00255 family)
MKTTNTVSEEKIAHKPECRSMTGYAMLRGEYSGWTIRVSVKSVNHRFLDVKLRMAETLEPYELRLRQVIREKIHRGHIEVQLNVERGESAPVHINKELLQSYWQAAEELKKRTGAANELDLVALMRLPGVIGGLAPTLPEDAEEQESFGVALENHLRTAVAKMDEMRRAEGRHLAAELRERLGKITAHTEEVRGLVATLRPAFARRLQARLKELLNGAGVDPSRVAQEAALLAERSDISEELDRLRSHLQQFAKLLDGAGELGKKLDFLLQEMHREANTMLSKTPGVESEALAVTGLALEIKSEIEKLREQVQNIE